MVESVLTSDSNGSVMPQVKRKHRWIWIVAILVLVTAAIALVRGKHKSTESAAVAQAASLDNRVVSIQVVTAARVDVPIILEGLGSVTPIATIVVKTQVDGMLNKVYFKEGQQVTKGQLLAQIDPPISNSTAAGSSGIGQRRGASGQCQARFRQV